MRQNIIVRTRQTGMIIFCLLFFAATSHAATLTPWFLKWDCPNGGTGWAVIEDTDGDGHYDKATECTCSGNTHSWYFYVDPISHDTTKYDYQDYGTLSSSVLTSAVGCIFKPGPAPTIAAPIWTWSVSILDSEEVATYDTSNASICSISRIDDGSLSIGCALEIPPFIEHAPANVFQPSISESQYKVSFSINESPEVLTLPFPPQLIRKVELFDVIGTAVKISNNVEELNGIEVPSGVYLVRFSYDGGSVVRKILVTN